MSETAYEIVVVTDQKEEAFDLTKVPEETSDLVRMQEKKLSAEIDLNQLISDLNKTATLLYISYNALSGTSAQSKVSGLQNNLSMLCAKSQTAMNGIEGQTQMVLKSLPMVYRFLVKGKAQEAMKLLASCSTCAGKMAQISEELAEGFEKMTNQAQEALESSQDLYASDKQKLEEIKKQITEMKAKQAALTAKETELKATIQEIQEKYTEAQKREERAEKNALITGIVGMVTSSLSAGLGAFANTVKTQQKTYYEQTEQSFSEQEDGTRNLENRQKELDEANQEREALKKELEAAEKELANIAEEFPGETEEEQADQDARKKAAEQKICEIKEKLQKKEETVSDKEKAVQAARATLQELSGQLADRQEEAKSALEKAQATTSELFRLKMDMQKENREIASSMAEIAAMLKGQEEVKIGTDKAVEMLKLAIRCLGNIVVSFTEAAIFWRTVEEGCNNLKDGAFMTQVRIFSEFDSELQSEMYASDEFKMLILEYMATWVALHKIGQEYCRISAEAGNKVRQNIRSNLFEQDAFAEAARLADEIMASMENDKNVIDQNMQVIETVYAEAGE